ncbi:MAG TPA: tetratricopeptide repeat protein, partial [Spirochaetota bacterium]|nr:tetratricopeptide repeat protein [Spirochaetota bacterium]
AREYFEKTKNIYVAAYGENHPFVGSSYYALALEYFNDGENGKAISYYMRACELYRNAYGENHAFVAASYSGLARVFTAMGDCEKAIGYLEKSRDIDYAVFGEEHINTIATLFGLADVLYQVGEYDESLEVAIYVLNLHRKVLGENHPDSASMYSLIGSLYYIKSDYPRSIEYYKKAVEITELTNGADHPTAGEVYPRLGKACYQNGDIVEGERYIRKGLEIGKKKALPMLIIDSFQGLAEISRKQGKWEKVREYYDGTIEIIERERSKTDAERSAVMDMGASNYYHSIEASAMLGDVDAMFSTAEKMKARSFLDRITLEAALSVDGISSEDRKKMMTLNERISSLISRRREAITGKDGKTDEKLIASLGKQVEEASADFDRFEAELMKNDGYRRLRKSSTATIPQAQSLCDGESAILEYVCDAEGRTGNVKPFCIVIRDKSKSIVSLDASYDFNAGIAKFRETIIEPNRKRERIRIGKELHGKLIEPLIPHLQGVKKLIIIPDGQLAFVPFDALNDNVDGAYLCEKYEITLDPSVSVLLMTRMRKSNAKLT